MALLGILENRQIGTRLTQGLRSWIYLSPLYRLQATLGPCPLTTHRVHIRGAFRCARSGAGYRHWRSLRGRESSCKTRPIALAEPRKEQDRAMQQFAFRLRTISSRSPILALFCFPTGSPSAPPGTARQNPPPAQHPSPPPVRSPSPRRLADSPSSSAPTAHRPPPLL